MAQRVDQAVATWPRVTTHSVASCPQLHIDARHGRGREPADEPATVTTSCRIRTDNASFELATLLDL